MYIAAYKFSIFGDFRRCEPTSAKMIEWGKSLQEAGYECLPNIIEQSIDPPFTFSLPPMPANLVKRAQFTTADGELTFRILNERIDVETSKIKAVDDDPSLEQRLKTLTALLKTAVDMLGGVKGTRIAFFVDGLLPESAKDAFQPFYQAGNLGILDGTCGFCAEWRHYANDRVTIEFAGKRELCNSILQLEKNILHGVVNKNGVLEDIEGLRFTSDINTLADYTAERFGFAEAEDFVQEAQKIHLMRIRRITDMLEGTKDE